MPYKDTVEFPVLPYTLLGYCCIIYGMKADNFGILKKN